MSVKKPDCTGQRFGRLVVVGLGETVCRYGKSLRVWNLQCDCGKVISLPRGDFDRGRQKSCGCLKKDRIGSNYKPNKPKHKEGDILGQLKLINVVEDSRSNKSYVWLCLCECGNYREVSAKKLSAGYKLNCGDKKHLPYSWYPPTPVNYPDEAKQLLVKHLPRTRYVNDRIVDAALEDERLERLIRAAYIICYRRSQGELISEKYESCLINKHLKYCAIDLFWRRKSEAYGDRVYNLSKQHKSLLKSTLKIGSEVTDSTFPKDPVGQPKTQENTSLTKNSNITKKRMSFKRR